MEFGACRTLQTMKPFGPDTNFVKDEDMQFWMVWDCMSRELLSTYVRIVVHQHST